MRFRYKLGESAPKCVIKTGLELAQPSICGKVEQIEVHAGEMSADRLEIVFSIFKQKSTLVCNIVNTGNIRSAMFTSLNQQYLNNISLSSQTIQSNTLIAILLQHLSIKMFYLSGSMISIYHAIANQQQPPPHHNDCQR